MSAVALLAAMDRGELTSEVIMSVFIARSSTKGIATCNVAEENYVEAMQLAREADARRKNPTKAKVRARFRPPPSFHILLRIAAHTRAAARPPPRGSPDLGQGPVRPEGL